MHQLVTDEDDPTDEVLPAHLRGRPLFGPEMDFWDLEARFRRGAVVKRTPLTAEFDLSDFHATHDVEGAPAIPLFRVSDEGAVEVCVSGADFEPRSGDTLIAIVLPEEGPDAAVVS